MLVFQELLEPDNFAAKRTTDTVSIDKVRKFQMLGRPVLHVVVYLQLPCVDCELEVGSLHPSLQYFAAFLSDNFNLFIFFGLPGQQMSLFKDTLTYAAVLVCSV